MSSPAAATTDDVRKYWNKHIHDLEITTHPVGSPLFFADLDRYHFEKLHHLLRLVNFDGYAGRNVLEVGCGAGTDLARFAKGGALVSGVDLSGSAIALAKTNFDGALALAQQLPGEEASVIAQLAVCGAGLSAQSFNQPLDDERDPAVNP